MQFDRLFSERQKELRSEVPDVYQYDTIPNKLRNQVIRIWEYALGDLYRYEVGGPYPIGASKVYQFIHSTLTYRYGKPTLGYSRDSDFESIHKFFLETEETEKVIDVIELSFRCIDRDVRNHPNKYRNRKITPDGAIKELNDRFVGHRVGYQYESGKIIRIDSKFIHSEAMKPALRLLSDPMYEGANEEFLKAHEHYRMGDYKACMNECLKAFESSIKTICDARGWNHNNKNGVRLIEIVFNEGLIPSFMQTHFTALRKTLEDGALNPRNQRSGHGQGSKIIPVPDYMAAYVLHLTASNILFLAKANEEMK